MSRELRNILQSSLRTTAVFCVILMAAALIFAKGEQKAAWCMAIALGAAVCELGLYMICSMANGLHPDCSGMKTKGASSYVLRYLMYGLVLFAGAWFGLPVLGMLAGLLAGKGSLLVYALQERKERQ